MRSSPNRAAPNSLRPAAERERDVAQAAGTETFHRQHGCGRGLPPGRLPRAGGDLQLASHHHADQLPGIGGSHLARAHRLAIAQHRHAVADTKNFVHFVRDVDHRNSAAAQAADESEQPFHAVVEQRTGGLVHQQEARVHAEDAGDGQQFAAARWKAKPPLGRRCGETYLIEERTAERFHPPETRQAPLAEEEVPDDHVFPGGQVREQVELLVDNGDAQPLRIERSVNGGRLPVEEEAPAIGPDGAGDDPGERALARAVFAHERVDFSRAHFQAGASQRRHAAETFAGIRDFQKGMGHQCYSLTPSRPPGTLV